MLFYLNGIIVEIHIFYPMNTWPEVDECDSSFSRTVIIYGEKHDFVELGFYDFEQGQWTHFGDKRFILKCWCYLPDPHGAHSEYWERVLLNGDRIY